MRYFQFHGTGWGPFHHNLEAFLFFNGGQFLGSIPPCQVGVTQLLGNVCIQPPSFVNLFEWKLHLLISLHNPICQSSQKRILNLLAVISFRSSKHPSTLSAGTTFECGIFSQSSRFPVWYGWRGAWPCLLDSLCRSLSAMLSAKAPWFEYNCSIAVTTAQMSLQP